MCVYHNIIVCPDLNFFGSTRISEISNARNKNWWIPLKVTLHWKKKISWITIMSITATIVIQFMQLND